MQLAVKPVYALTLYHSFLLNVNGPIASLCYFLKGYRPNKTVSHASSFSHLYGKEWILFFVYWMVLQGRLNKHLSMWHHKHNHLSYTVNKKDLYMVTVKLLGSSCLTITTWHLHHEFNFTSRILETVENSLPLSYMPLIKRLLIALHYHGQSYRGH
jgi:hypothetical protein